MTVNTMKRDRMPDETIRILQKIKQCDKTSKWGVIQEKGNKTILEKKKKMRLQYNHANT